MNTGETLDALHEEPPGCGDSSKPSPSSTYLRRVEAAHKQGDDTEHTHRPALNRAPLKLSWNKLHILARQEICWGACVSEKMADKSWEELDRWLQVLLEYSTELRSRGKLKLSG